MMAADPNGGYWTVDFTGAVAVHSGAIGFGSPSLSNLKLKQPIVGMASTPDGNGYWLVASDGGIFSYGDASFYGSTGAIHLNQPIVAMASTADAGGYWLVASDGGIFSYGDASFYGSTAGTGSSALGIVVNPPEGAYALISPDGSAAFFGHRSSRTVQPPNTTTTRPPTTTTRPPATTTTTRPPPATITTSTTTVPPAATTAGLQSGSYDGAANTSGASSFASETGTTSSIYSDYAAGENETWTDWNKTIAWLIPQLKGKIGSSRLELSVPLASGGYSSQAAAMAAFAANPATFDANMTNLAQSLVANGFSNTIIRLMWEPQELGLYSNDDLTSAASYADLFRDAHTAMDAVSGSSFSWAWYWEANFDSNTNNTAYPGSAYVDYITNDFYDQSWVTTCGITYNGTSFTAAQENCLWSATNGYSATLKSLTNFATVAQKPIGIGEWGVIDRSDNHGGNDDPTFIANYAAWMKSSNVAWASYFNFNDGGSLDSTLAHFPNSLAAYKADVG